MAMKNMNKYRVYKRGQIVAIDFAPSTGSELAGTHYAIVLNKKDFPGNGVLTVVPLTSKNKPYYINLGDFVFNHIYKSINSELETLLNQIQSLENMNLDNDKDVLEYQKIAENVRLHFHELSKHQNMFRSKAKESFAMVQNISTVSKFKVKRLTPYFDPHKNLKIPDGELDKIDKKIIELYTR